MANDAAVATISAAAAAAAATTATATSTAAAFEGTCGHLQAHRYMLTHLYHAYI